jgi:hypothetical protein
MRVTKKFTGACCIGKRVFNTAAAQRRAITPEDMEVGVCGYWLVCAKRKGGKGGSVSSSCCVPWRCLHVLDLVWL